MLLSDAVATSMGQAVIDAIDSASPTVGYLVLYDDADATLATMDLADPCATVTDGLITFAAISDVNAVATGTASYVKVYDGNDTLIFTFNVGETGSGADVTINSTAVVDGELVSVAALTFTVAGLGFQP